MNCSKITLTNNGLSAWNTSFEIISLLNQNYINELSLITLQNVNGISDLLFFANVKNIRDFVLTNTSVVDIKDLPKPNKIGTFVFAGNNIDDFSVLSEITNENVSVAHGGPSRNEKDKIYILKQKGLDINNRGLFDHEFCPEQGIPQETKANFTD
jgi:Leucine-rich repeat (LRR) protein